MISEAPKRKVAKSPNRRLAYFRDDQITFLVTHDEDLVSDNQLKEFVSDMEKYLQGGQIVWPPRKFSFPAPSSEEDQPSPKPPERLEKAFSIIVCDVENVPDDPQEFLSFIAELNHSELRNQEFAGLTLKAVSPNWLASGASQAGGTGGPGSWPVPFRGMPSRAPYRFPELFSLLPEDLYGDGEGVDVAILDTAPCGHDLIAAYKEYKSWHPLIRTLLGPGGKLKLYPATYDELLRMGSTSLNDHDYKMTDHGLFAAGLVHTIAPKATIHLIEVLNAYGVGDLATLAGGFDKAYNMIRKSDRSLVVNCSWMLDLPLEPKHCHAESVADPEFEFERSVLRFAQNDQDHAYALRSVCELLERAGSQVIAAAGNDGRGENDRRRAPQARYPAAFDKAVGVGALPKDMKPGKMPDKLAASSYSNLADKPATTGFMMLGGEAGEEQGVLGLYLGEFPGCEPTPNCTKWAWWAGTSFATPILTGAIAAALSSPRGFRTTQEALGALVGIMRDKTDAGEDALPMTQDY